jgi:hypothetical protein
MRIILLLTFALALTACSKDDDDSPEPLEQKEDLSNTYFQSTTIINVPPYYWDNGSSPDLYLTLAPLSNLSAVYSTVTINNVERAPQLLEFQQLVPMTNELWELTLYDEDDVIYVIQFNPHSEASRGKIPIYQDGLLVLEFNYVKQ